MQHDFVFPSLIRGRVKFSTPLNLSMSWYCIKQQNTVGGGKEPACQCRRPKRRGVDPWVGEIPWRRARNPLQCLGNRVDRGAWPPAVHGLTKTQTRLSGSHTHTHTHTHPMDKPAGVPFLFLLSNFSEHHAIPL